MDAIEQLIISLETSLGVSGIELFILGVILFLIWRMARKAFGRDTTGMFAPQEVKLYTQKSPFQVVMDGCVNLVMALAILVFLILILVVVFKPEWIGLGG